MTELAFALSLLSIGAGGAGARKGWMVTATRPAAYALKLGAKSPLEWTDAHQRAFRHLDMLWDDLRAIWIQSLHEQELAEEATGDADLLACRRAVTLAVERVSAAFQARRDWRQAIRSVDSTPELEAEIEAAREARKAAWSALKPAQRRVRAEIREQLQGIWAERDRQMYDRACRSGVRGYPDLHVTTCTDVLRRFRAAIKLTKGRPPRPSCMHESTSIYRQIQPRNTGGELVPDPIYARDPETKKLTDEIIGYRKKRKRVGGQQYGAALADLCARGVGGIRFEPHEVSRSSQRWMLLVVPIQTGGPEIRLPVRIDRETPRDAQIKGVRVVRRGREWHAVLSVGAAPEPITPGRGVLYAGINWRRQSDGSLRILDGVDGQGTRYRVSLPAWHMASVRYADLLQSALDRRANEAARQLAAEMSERADWIAACAERKRWCELHELSPAWADGLHQREGKRTHGMLLDARRRCGGDAEKYADAAAEILGDRIGRRWLEGMRSKSVRRREHLYRECARWIAEHFERVVLAKSDGQKLARIEDPDTGDRTALPLPARRQRQAAAPYSLQQSIRWAMAKAGSEVVEVSAKDRSRTCPLCGRRMDAPGREGELYMHCVEHGRWDRDHALAASLWSDEVTADAHERWALALRAGERSQAQIVSIDAELEPRANGRTAAFSRLRYAAGAPLANEVNS